jgi:hypothetical protein
MSDEKKIDSTLQPEKPESCADETNLEELDRVGSRGLKTRPAGIPPRIIGQGDIANLTNPFTNFATHDRV